MKTQAILARAAQGVIFLFAAFSGFLKGVAPPEETGSGFAVGVASFLSLCVLLLLSGRSQNRKDTAKERRLWFSLAGTLTLVAAGAALTYYHNTNRLTFGYPPDNPNHWYVAGTEYLAPAATLARQAQLSPAKVVAQFGGLPNTYLVWRKESIDRARLILVTNYLVFTLSIAGAVFSLVEMSVRAQVRSR
jgi:hypothetical protein